MVDHAADRRLDRVDRERVEHQPEDAVAGGERAQLLVGEVARRLVDGAAAGVRDADPALVRVEALVEDAAATRARGRGSRRAPRSAPAAHGRAARARPRRRRRRRTGCAGSTSVRPSAARAPRRDRRSRPRSRTARRPRARASARSARRARPRRGRRATARRARRSGLSRSACWSAVTCRSASRSEPSGCSSRSTKTGQTCSPTPPASSSGSHVRAKTSVSPSRCSRWASSSRMSTWASAITSRSILSAMATVASTKTFAVTNPATGEVLEQRAAARGRGDAGGDRSRRARLPGVARADGQGARGRAAAALGPDARAAGGARAAADERAGQAAGGGAGRDRLRGLVLRVVRRGGEARLRRHDPGAPARQADRRPEGADRRHRGDHALELSRRDDHAQGGAGARRRLHDRRQARRADAVDRARARRRSPPRPASPTVCSRSSPATRRTRR